MTSTVTYRLLKSSKNANSKKIRFHASAITYALSLRLRISRIPKLFLQFLYHFVATLAVAAFLLFYVPNHLFGTKSRVVHATQADGSSISAGYRPLQSDITTIVSFLASITRILGTLWASDLLWRCVFLFTLKGGISLKGTKQMFSMLPPPVRRDFKRASTFVWFCLVQFAVFSSNFYSPTLTGSITWGPDAFFIRGTVPINSIPQSGPDSSLEYYFQYPEVITQVVATASARANLVWIGSNSRAMKRVLPTVAGMRFLRDGTKLENITLPFFKVESFEWIKDPNTTLTPGQLQIVNTTDGFSPFFAGIGKIGFLPDDHWGPLNKTNNPAPRHVLETRILAVRTSRRNETVRDCSAQDFGTVPSDVGYILLQSGGHNDCMRFANVTYQACAAHCQHCRISSWTAVDSEGVDPQHFQLAPDRFVEEALAIVPYLSTHLLFSDYVTPNFMDSAESRSLELISRSFQAAWMALTDTFQDSTYAETTNVAIAVESTKATVDKQRVYLWCIFNFFLLLVGFSFRIVDGWCSGVWLDSPSLTAVLLNTKTPGEQSQAETAANPWEQDDLPDGILTRYPSGRFVLHELSPQP